MGMVKAVYRALTLLKYSTLPLEVGHYPTSCRCLSVENSPATPYSHAPRPPIQ